MSPADWTGIVLVSLSVAGVGIRMTVSVTRLVDAVNRLSGVVERLDSRVDQIDSRITRAGL